MKGKNDEEIKTIKPINYLWLGIIIIVTFFAMTEFIMWYADTKKEVKDLSIATQIFSQINSNEVDNYLIENPNAFIYIASSMEDNLAFEQDLQTLINKYYLKDHFVYLDIANITDASFYNNLYKNSFGEDLKKELSSFTGYTNIMYIVDGKVVDLLYEKKQQPNIKDVKKFLIDKGIALVDD
jgi:hypothetical protein